MVRVVDVRALDGCLDSSVVREVVLDAELTEQIMRRMAADASLQYFPHFPRPYFRISRPGWWVIQGVLGNTSVRVTHLRPDFEDAERVLRRLVEGEPDGSAGGAGA